MMKKNEVAAFDIGGTLIHPISGDWYITDPVKKKLFEYGLSSDQIRAAMNKTKQLRSEPRFMHSEQEEFSYNLSFYRTFFSLLPLQTGINDTDLQFFSKYRVRAELLYEFDPRIRKMLELVEKKEELALFSNTIPSVINYLKQNRILQFFRYEILSCNCGMKKPEIDIFELLLNETGCDPSEIILYDDNIDVINTAAKFGIRGKLVRYDNLCNFLEENYG